MARAQGSLEYLIILAAAIGVVAVVILFSTNAFTPQQKQYSLSSCLQAASNCKLAISGNPSDPCAICNASCKDAITGDEIFSGAARCCRQGRTEMIYTGSPGCVQTNELFYDEFSTLDAWTGDKQVAGFSGWYITAAGYNNSNSAFKQRYGSHYISRAQSTLGYQDINISFWASPDLKESTESMQVQWSSDGSTWTTIYIHQGGASDKGNSPFIYYSYLLPSTAENNPNFAVKVVCYDAHNPPEQLGFGVEHCDIDTFRIRGTVLE